MSLAKMKLPAFKALERAFRLTVGLFMFGFLASCGAQGTLLTVTFEGPPAVQPGHDVGESYYYEAGMTFTPLAPGDIFGRMHAGRAAFPDNGGTYLILAAFDSLSGACGSNVRFGLVSVDLSEFSTVYPIPKTVQFVGYRTDGTVVTTEFTTDGIIDGTGPLADFQTFYFDQRFSDLVRFEVPSVRYALDNLVYRYGVPEPNAAALVLFGVSLLGWRRLKH